MKFQLSPGAEQTHIPERGQNAMDKVHLIYRLNRMENDMKHLLFSRMPLPHIPASQLATYAVFALSFLFTSAIVLGLLG